jgi:hypothetical protein
MGLVHWYQKRRYLYTHTISFRNKFTFALKVQKYCNVKAMLHETMFAANSQHNWRFPLYLRFRSALYCGYSGITDIQDGLFFVLTHARTFKKARVKCAIAISKIFGKTFKIFIRGRYLYQWYHYNHNAGFSGSLLSGSVV